MIASDTKHRSRPLPARLWRGFESALGSPLSAHHAGSHNELALTIFRGALNFVILSLDEAVVT
jgi:hypothetical protein